MKIEKYVDVGFTMEGKRIRKWIKANSQAEFNRQYTELKERYKEVSVSDITFQVYASKWLTVYKSSREAKTIEMYENALRKTSLIDHQKVRDIRPIDLQELINENKDSPTACKQLHLTLNQIFKRSIKDKIREDNPADDLELPKQHPSEERILKDSEIEAIKNAELDPMDRMYMELLFYFGLRPQEALALMITDFDFQEQTVTIRRAVGFDRNDPYIKTTKTNNVRILPIPDIFVPKLKSYIKQIKSENSLYLIHRNGNVVSKTVMVKMWHRIRKEINRQLKGTDLIDMTDGLRPYTFRHTFCTRCLYAGVSIKKCQYLMGHHSTQMVMKVYSHIDNEKEPLDELRKVAL